MSSALSEGGLNIEGSGFSTDGSHLAFCIWRKVLRECIIEVISCSVHVMCSSCERGLISVFSAIMEMRV